MSNQSFPFIKKSFIPPLLDDNIIDVSSDSCCNNYPICPPPPQIINEYSKIHDINYLCCPGLLTFYDIKIPSNANDGDIIRVLPSNKWGYNYIWYIIRIIDNQYTLHKLNKYNGELYLSNNDFDLFINKGSSFFKSIIDTFELPYHVYTKQNDDTNWIPVHINNKFLIKSSSSGKVNVFHNNILYTFKNMHLIPF